MDALTRHLFALDVKMRLHLAAREGKEAFRHELNSLVVAGECDVNVIDGKVVYCIADDIREVVLSPWPVPPAPR
jgi:hypothetical protein